MRTDSSYLARIICSSKNTHLLLLLLLSIERTDARLSPTPSHRGPAPPLRDSSALEMPLAPPLNLPLWLRTHGELLKPPVNNFCLYAGADYVVMAVGGPNERRDYHVNETEVRRGVGVRVLFGPPFWSRRCQGGRLFLDGRGFWFCACASVGHGARGRS